MNINSVELTLELRYVKNRRKINLLILTVKQMVNTLKSFRESDVYASVGRQATCWSYANC